MTKPKIHYDHPTLSCFYGGQKTTDKNKVTCNNCLNKIKGKVFGRPTKKAKTKHKLTAFTLSPFAHDRLSLIPKNMRSQFVSKLIETAKQSTIDKYKEENKS